MFSNSLDPGNPNTHNRPGFHSTSLLGGSKRSNDTRALKLKKKGGTLSQTTAGKEGEEEDHGLSL